MTVWDILIALSGIEDYAVRYDDKGEAHLADPETLPPTDTVIPVTPNRWQRIIHGAKHLHL